MELQKMEIISRDEALSRGLKKFYTGRPCKHGHRSERYTVSYICIKCNQSATGNARMLARFGISKTVVLTFRNVHREDAEVIKGVVAMLRAARGEPAEEVVTQPKAVEKDQYWEYKLWLSVHGEETARTMCRLNGSPCPAPQLSNRERMLRS